MPNEQMEQKQPAPKMVSVKTETQTITVVDKVKTLVGSLMLLSTAGVFGIIVIATNY